MNLPLNFGLLGALEAGAIALLIGVAMYALWHWIAARASLHQAHAIGISCLFAVLISAGIDTWHMFYLGTVKLESPLYARIALQEIHDPDGLGTRVLLEVVGALAGVLLSRLAFSARSHDSGGSSPSSSADSKR